MDDLAKIIGDYDAFLREILSEVEGEGFELSDFVQLDHMCYRVTSLSDYQEKKTQLSEVAGLMGETQVNGRPIATFRLNVPVKHDKWRIDAVELPAPKESSKFDKGLEHVEFVLFDDKETFLKKYAHKQFELKSADRGINPEIGFKLPSYTVKFHLLNLPTVVYLEAKLGMHNIQD